MKRNTSSTSRIMGKIIMDASSRPASRVKERLVIFGQEKEAQASCAETLLNVCMRPDTAIHPPFLLSEYNLAQ